MTRFAHSLLGVAVVVGSMTTLASGQETFPVQGEWVLNRELTPAMPARGEDGGPPRPRGGGDFPRGGPGGGPPGGGSGFGGGMRGGRGEPNEKERRAFDVVRWRLEEIPQRLVITIDGTRVQIVDEAGRTTNLIANGKKQERLTGEGEFTSTTKVERGVLTVEDDFGRFKIITTYEHANGENDADDRLKVTLTIDGLRPPPGPPGGRTAGPQEPVARIYDAKR